MADRVSSPDLIGRAAELAVLDQAFEQAANGSSRIVLVGGDSGVGKSRVVAEFASRASDAGARTLAGECVELSEGEIPFAPLALALRRLAREMEGDEFAAILGPARDELTRMFPDLIPPSPAAHETPGVGSTAQSRLFELLLGVLERLGSDSPVLVVIEDLHWADRSTRDLLLFLARSVRHERLLIVVTYRSDELHRRHPLRPFLVQIERMSSVQRIDLEPLSREEMANQLEQILGEQPPPAIGAAIYERSEGNPFFTEELIAASAGGSNLPATLRDTLLLRTERLSRAAQQLLAVVAAAGRRAQHGLLTEVLDLPESELLDGLREAVGHHVLVEAADEASYEFRHALMREAVYDDLLPGERGKLHVALASALERAPGLAGQTSSVAAELAYHWYAAHELERALRASVEAGIAAERIYAFAEADRHFGRALELWDRVPSDAERGIDRHGLLLHAADAAHHAGDNDRAVGLIQVLLGELDEHTDPQAVAHALGRLGRYLWVAGRGAEALGVYRRAVDVLPPEPSVERARALAAQGQILMLSDRMMEAKALCDEALPIGRAVGDRLSEANILNTLVACASYIGDYEAGGQWTEAARAVAEEIQLPDEIMRAYVNGSDCLDQSGRVAEALALALEGAEVARRNGLERHSGLFMQAEAAWRLLRLGRWEEASRMSRAVIAASSQPLDLVIAGETETLIATERGDFERARTLLEQAHSIVFRQGGSMWIPTVSYPLALLELREGRPEQARATIDEALSQFDHGEYVFYTSALYWAAARAEADIAERARPLHDEAVLAECEKRAAALIPRLDGLLGAYAEREPPPIAVAFRALAIAELSRVRGESDPALWAAAAECFERLGQIHDRAYACFRQAEALAHAGTSREEAGVALAAAREHAKELGMGPLMADIDALARRARIKLAAEAAASTAPPDEAAASVDLGLTERELQVLALVAQGHTNRQIGGELFMSEKTASVHVSRILSKLGAANRAEAAASAERLGLVTST